MNIHRFEPILISLISLHSLILGAAMLFKPAFTLKFFGWDYDGLMFFPAQTGIFLILFGSLYLSAIWFPRILFFMIITKVTAVVFLVFQYFLLAPSAPRTLLAAAVLDGLMGMSLITVYIWKRVYK